jgi:hypothetical protein
MPLPHSRAFDQSTDRRDEFVAVVAAVLPQTSQALETLARYTLAAALWGLIVYLALNVLVS